MGDETWTKRDDHPNAHRAERVDKWRGNESKEVWSVRPATRGAARHFLAFDPTVAEAEAVLRMPEIDMYAPIDRATLLTFVRSSGDPELCESVTPVQTSDGYSLCPGCGSACYASQPSSAPREHFWHMRCLAECIGNVAACPVCKNVLDEAAVHPAPGGVATHLECLERAAGKREFRVGDLVRNATTQQEGTVECVRYFKGQVDDILVGLDDGAVTRVLPGQLTLVSPAKPVEPEVPELARCTIVDIYYREPGNGHRGGWGGPWAVVGHTGDTVTVINANGRTECRCHVDVRPATEDYGHFATAAIENAAAIAVPHATPAPTPQEAPAERRFVGCESCEVMVLESAAHEVAADTHLCPACFSGRATPYVHEGATATNPAGFVVMPSMRYGGVTMSQPLAIHRMDLAPANPAPRKGDVVAWDDEEAVGRRGLVVSTRTHTEVEREGPKLYLSIRFARGEEPKWMQASKCTVVQKREAL